MGKCVPIECLEVPSKTLLYIYNERCIFYCVFCRVHLRESMSTSGWCSLMTSLLHSPTGHDSVEKIINAMSTLVGTCKAEFVPARTKLQALLGEYQKLAEDEIQEGSEDLYHSIYSNIKSLVQEIYREDL